MIVTQQHPALVHVGICATDIEASLRVWQEARGLEVVVIMPDYYDLSDAYHNIRIFL